LANLIAGSPASFKPILSFCEQKDRAMDRPRNITTPLAARACIWHHRF
jgi:hypothetical protein